MRSVMYKQFSRSRMSERKEETEEEDGLMFELITPPAIEPVTVDEVKVHQRIIGSDQDAVISGLITAARQVVENHTGRHLIDQTWQGVTDRWMVPFELIGNARIIQSVSYYAEDNVSTTMASEQYYLITSGLVPVLYFFDGVILPSIAARADAVKVLLTAGYGALAEDVPMAIRQAILLLVGHYYENRESTTPVSVNELPSGFAGLGSVEALLLPYKIPVVR